MSNAPQITIKWSEPQKVKTKYGLRWLRSWTIPDNLLEGFFLFWNAKKEVLKPKGYTLGKNRLDKWTLNEWQVNRHDFKLVFGKENVAVDYTDIPTVSTLPEYTVKNPEGLRVWQVPNVSKLCSSLIVHNAAIDGSDTGSGKTFSAIAAARELNLKIAVVCPKAVITSWKRCIENHFKMDYVFVLNYESVKTGKYESIGSWKSLSKSSTKETFVWDLPKDTLLIFDESHRLKGEGTKNSDIALSAKKQGYRILCCSATNAINPVELKTVGLILGIYKAGKWTRFMEDHGCVKGQFGWEFNGNHSVLKKLHYDLFIQRGVRLKKDNIPNFPECDTIAEAYNLDERSEKELNDVYKEMERELTLLKATTKTAKAWKENSMTVMLRARQRAELIKVPLLVEMCGDALEEGMSIVIFTNFVDSMVALMKRLHTKCVVWGGNKGDERQNNIDAFQADRERVILVQMQAGGAGLSLHDLNGKYPRLALISPDPSAVNLKQALGRIHRDGAKTKALQKIVFAAGTPEVDVCEKLSVKLANLDLINDGDLSNTPIFEDSI